MKLFLAAAALASVAFSQTAATTVQNAKDCAQNFVGNNNTGTITCYNVDKKLADQIGQLVAASKRDAKTLKDISDKLETLRSGIDQSNSITQSNSGGINIQQGTTGSNSPIINSPITVGDAPKTIQSQDREALKKFFQNAPTKAKIEVWADQVSGVSPLPDDFYDVLKDAKWVMVQTGVNHYMGFAAPGRRFQGAIVTIKGDPLGPGEGVTVGPSDPLFFIGQALQALGVTRSLNRDPKMDGGLIKIDFQGGFPR